MMSFADAIIAEDIESVRQALHYGIDVNQLDEYGFTPLIEAAIANNTEIAELLIDQGADVNQQDLTGGTALHWAAENNNIHLTELLLEHQADANACNFAGQPVLVMPLLRNQHAIKKILQQRGASLAFAQDYANTKLLGHVFELVGTADLIDPHNNFVEVDFEGFYLECSLSMICHALIQFNNHFAARKLRQFTQIIHIITEALDRASHLMKFQQYQTDLKEHQEKINGLLAQEPLIIPVGYEGHAITFVKSGNILAKCDRREDSRLYDNIMFYSINRPQALTTAFIKKMIYEKNSSEFINSELHHLLDLQPITELKVEAQVSGNCSWANVEATIPTVFFLLCLTAGKQNYSQYKSMALDLFHQWREWNRDRTLQFCIQSLKSSDSIRGVCKAEILAAILFQCYRQQTSANHERITSILAILGLPQFRYILQNYIQAYYFEAQHEEGKEFKMLLEMHGVKL